MPPSAERRGDFTDRAAGPRRRAGRGAPYLAPAALLLAAALAAWLGRGRLAACGAGLGSPEAQIRQLLSQPSRARMDDVYGFGAGGAVELGEVRFYDVAPLLEGDRATVVAMLTASGRVTWRGREARLSYLGRERFHMRRCAIARWCADGEQLERLRGVLAALFRLDDARERRDLDACLRLRAAAARERAGARGAGEGAGGALRVAAWQIRVERDEAQVGEDLATVAPGPPARSERRVYRLVREGGRWAFDGGEWCAR